MSPQTLSLVDETGRMSDVERRMLLARIIGTAAVLPVTLDAIRAHLDEMSANRRQEPGVAEPSSQAGLQSFVHLRNEPGATTTGS